MYQVKLTFNDGKELFSNIDDQYIDEYLRCVSTKEFFVVGEKRFYINWHEVRNCEVYPVVLKEKEDQEKEVSD